MPRRPYAIPEAGMAISSEDMNKQMANTLRMLADLVEAGHHYKFEYSPVTHYPGGLPFVRDISPPMIQHHFHLEVRDG
jgi:hypothetical protein